MDRPLFRGVLASGLTFWLMLQGCSTPTNRELVQLRAEELYGKEYETRLTPDQPPPDEQELLTVANLDRFIAFGLENNAGLRAAFERFRAGSERAAQVSSLPDPTFSYTEFIEDLETRTGPQERRFGLKQKLPFFGKQRLRGEVADQQAEELWQGVLEARLAVVRDITIAFHDYSYLAESLRITGENLELLKQLEPVVQRRIQGGADQSDLLTLQVEIGKVENDLTTLKDRRAPLNARLAAVMNYQGRARLPLPSLKPPQVTVQEASGYVDRALRQNPRLQALRKKMAGARKAVDLAGLSRWPDLTLGVDYFQTGSAVAPGTSGSGDDPVSVSVLFNLPIWPGKYTAEKREARSNLHAASHEHADLQARLRADVELVAYELADAGRQISLYSKTLLPRAREALTLTRTAYRAGKRSLLDVIASERALLAFEISYWRACRDYVQGQARMKAIVGGEVK